MTINEMPGPPQGLFKLVGDEWEEFPAAGDRLPVSGDPRDLIGAWMIDGVVIVVKEGAGIPSISETTKVYVTVTKFDGHLTRSSAPTYRLENRYINIWGFWQYNPDFLGEGNRNVGFATANCLLAGLAKDFKARF